jgi:hypothetical protein
MGVRLVRSMLVVALGTAGGLAACFSDKAATPDGGAPDASLGSDGPPESQAPDAVGDSPASDAAGEVQTPGADAGLDAPAAEATTGDASAADAPGDSTVADSGRDAETGASADASPTGFSETFPTPGALGLRVAVDYGGNIFAVGHFKTSIDFSGGADAGPCFLAGSASDDDAFVVKLDPAGRCIWARAYGGAGNQEAYRLGLDLSDTTDVVVTGEFQGTMDFGGGQVLTSAGGYDVFVARLSGATGSTVWARGFGDSADQIGQGIGTDGVNVYVGGTFSGSVYFAATDAGLGSPLTAVGTDVFLGTLSFADGAYVSAASFGDTGDDSLSDLYVRDVGDLALAGVGPSGIFAAKMSGGAIAWTKTYAGSGGVTGVAIGASDEVLINGTCDTTLDFGNGTTLVTDAGTGSIFTASLAPGTGNGVWAKSFGPGFGGGVVTDPNSGEVFITGYFTAAIDFGLGPLTSPTGQTYFLAGLDAVDGHGISGMAATNTAYVVGLGLASQPGYVVSIGYFNGTLDFHDGADGGSHPLAGASVAPFVAKILH